MRQVPIPVNSCVHRVPTPCLKRKMAHVVSEQSDPVQHLSSCASLGPCTPSPALRSRNPSNLSLRSVLIKYMNYRMTHADASKCPSQIAKILHTRFCKYGRCICDRVIDVLSHVDNCCDLECLACKHIQSSFLAGGQEAVNLKGSSTSDFSSYARSDVAEDYPCWSKRAKIVSPETQFFQPSPKAQAVHIHDETLPTKDTHSPSSCCSNLTDDAYAKSSTPMYSEEEETVVGGTFEQTKQATKTDQKKGVSILDFFTLDELREHLSSLRPSSYEDIEGSKMINENGENTCQLCGVEKLMFAPKPIYCSTCGGCIKKGVVYYFTFDGKASKASVCATCFRAFHGNIPIGGKSISKSKFQTEKNDPEEEEPWVQCDRCGGWQHQICGIYNDRIDSGGKEEYICPKCYLVRVETGEHVPIRKNPTFGAKNLPTTKLSDYIEERLFGRLKRDREERAKASQKSFDDVPGATDLVVRVVLSANKLLKVNEQFSQIFRDQKYPSEFPYRSKLILLFQKIEGIDVCLFAMYIQEYGSECGCPNQRSVYISHLDSVKHFRPEIRSANGEALRTFVYHEIIIGYLDYCKKRGFTTAYIWSCPPMKGDDYIFYCHPETQKTPKPDQLRQWYRTVLKKAAKENIVVDLPNFYDHYFVPNKESDVKVSMARLPHFDGDYWSSTAMYLINNKEKGIKMNSKKKLEEVVSRRTLKAFGHKELSEDSKKDILLMQKLGEKILPLREDFFMVNLQEAAVVDDMVMDTEDADAILETDYFKNNNSFLSFCQGNHLRGSSETTFPYQFDSIRRAKHSSMMILYHLHLSIKKAAQDCGENVGDTEPFRNMQMVKLLDDLLHFSECDATGTNDCSHPRCRIMRDVFHHSSVCTVGVTGNCVVCRKLSALLKKHSKDCGNATCLVPHLKELEKHGELFSTQPENQSSVAIEVPLSRVNRKF